MASFLSGLKFTADKSKTSAGPGDITSKVRTKFIEAVEGQRELVQADIDGVEFQTNKKRIFRWYWKSGTAWKTTLKYGTTSIKSNGLEAIEVGKDQQDLLRFYQSVIDATGKGELDEELIALSKKRSEMRIGKKRTPRISTEMRDYVAEQKLTPEQAAEKFPHYGSDAEAEADEDDQPEVPELERVPDPEPVAKPTRIARKTR